MSIPSKTENIIVCLDNSGYVNTAVIAYHNKEHIITDIKTFNAHIASNDNSVWSVDVKYPYIIIGGNHKGVLVLNYEEQIKEGESTCVNSVLYKGNEHNVPSVRISPCGLFIVNNSIDSHIKVFDFYKKKLLCKFKNPNNEWGWNAMFIPKRLFEFKECNFDLISNEDNFVTTLLHLNNANLTNKNQIHKHSNVNNETESNDDDKYYYKYIEDNLLNKYYILSTSRRTAYLNELVFTNADDDKTIINKPLGKIELTRNYMLEVFRGVDQLTTFEEVFFLKQLSSCGRYEFLFIAETMRLIFMGNKVGDLQIFKMDIEFNENDNKIGINDKPEFIIDYSEKLVGIRIIENDNGNAVDIYALDLKGTIHQHRITRKNDSDEINVCKCDVVNAQEESNEEVEINDAIINDVED